MVIQYCLYLERNTCTFKWISIFFSNLALCKNFGCYGTGYSHFQRAYLGLVNQLKYFKNATRMSKMHAETGCFNWFDLLHFLCLNR